MEVSSSLTTDFVSQPFAAVIVTALCLLFALFTIRSLPSSFTRIRKYVQLDYGALDSSEERNCSAAESDCVPESPPYLNGGVEEMQVVRAPPVAVERLTGASMMEQLVPEITTHALSYLDYQSLCRLSMTNSWMRKAANDDTTWKALFHKDFTLEQDNVTPSKGWKAYYAATRAVVNVNVEFFNIISEGSLPAMSRLWHKADYVKCIHASGELFSGYNDVIRSWQSAFQWDPGFDFQVRDVRARVGSDMAWVTMQCFINMVTSPFSMTNVLEFHKGRWYIVHHHGSVVIDGVVAEQIVNGQ